MISFHEKLNHHYEVKRIDINCNICMIWSEKEFYKEMSAAYWCLTLQSQTKISDEKLLKVINLIKIFELKVCGKIFPIGLSW